MSTHRRRPMTSEIRRMTRPDTMWYHPHTDAMTWSHLKRLFAGIGGITVARAILLGWSTDPRNGAPATANPVNRMLGPFPRKEVQSN